MCVVKLVSTLGKGSEKKGSRREMGQSSRGLGSLSPACTCNALQIATQPRHMKMLNTRPVAMIMAWRALQVQAVEHVSNGCQIHMVAEEESATV